MPKQPAFPSMTDAMKKKVTRREQFLAEMDAVVLWTRFLALIEPHYPTPGRKGGRPPMPLETMLRIYLLQNWYALSDPIAEEMLYDSEAMRRFVGTTVHWTVVFSSKLHGWLGLMNRCSIPRVIVLGPMADKSAPSLIMSNRIGRFRQARDAMSLKASMQRVSP